LKGVSALSAQDVQLLLENRGLPAIGEKEELTERLHAALSEEICGFEWEAGDVPACHAGGACTFTLHPEAVMCEAGLHDLQMVSACKTRVRGAHAEIIGAGTTMCTHHNSVYVFGGMDDERAEHMSMWKWDLSGDEGFEPVTYRCARPGPMHRAQTPPCSTSVLHAHASSMCTALLRKTGMPKCIQALTKGLKHAGLACGVLQGVLLEVHGG
jgi:hypothetical protein